MKKVWDAIITRRDATGRSHIVSMICHTFSVGQQAFEQQLAGILDYVTEHEGRPPTPSQAKRMFDQNSGSDIHRTREQREFDDGERPENAPRNAMSTKRLLGPQWQAD